MIDLINLNEDHVTIVGDFATLQIICFELSAFINVSKHGLMGKSDHAQMALSQNDDYTNRNLQTHRI